MYENVPIFVKKKNSRQADVTRVSLKVPKGETKVNVELVQEFDVKNVPVKLHYAIAYQAVNLELV